MEKQIELSPIEKEIDKLLGKTGFYLNISLKGYRS